jgi:hypothetical protein
MSADLSRIRSNPLRDYAGVELKQGAVVLDGDVNELVAIVDRRLRAAASDILGRSTVSSTTPLAFRITATASGLQIDKGRLYVDGLLAENHGAVSTDPADRVFDALMGEAQYADPIAYNAQPYFPAAPALPATGRHLVYLDVWDREVTHIEQPDLVEAALGVETSSRRQTVWQIRVLSEEAGTATCGTPDAGVPGWPTIIAPSTGRLTTGTFEVPPEDDPCELPPSGGYRGLENQTYRVEIHDPGQPGGIATFKWSRDNASVASRVASVISSTELELQTLGRDEILRFNSGDWVEILDDVREFAQRAGEMRKITVNEAARRITFSPALPAEMSPGSFPNAEFPESRNLRVRRWDQKHEVLRVGAGGSTPVFQDLDAGTTGVITVPAAGTSLLLERGITVQFASLGTKGFRAGDYWVFAARTADASIEILDAAPPRGIHHHFARLGIWDVGAGSVTDCRTPWPPTSEGHDCSCVACVTPESHASGALTIQSAVDRLRDTGGTVCLGVGQYALQEPVRLTGTRAVRIKGQGGATVIVTPGGAFAITNALGPAIEDLAIVSLGQAAIVSVRSALGLSLQRLLMLTVRNADARNAVGITLSGAVLGAAIRDNAIMTPIGIVGPALTAPDNQPRPILLSAGLHIERNVLWCERTALVLAGLAVHVFSSRFADNEVVGCRAAAINALGVCAPGASFQITGNTANVTGGGISASVDGLLIEGNKLTAGAREDREPTSAGITLRTGLDPNGSDQCQILSNQIAGFPGAGIEIRSPVRALIVKLNIIERCGNGIVSEDDTSSATASIENNHLSDIGTADTARAGFVAGISVARAETATVSGNTIRRVGVQEIRVPLRAGIVAASVGRLRANGNDIADVGPPGEFVGVGAGIMLLAPYAEAEIATNHVARDAQVSSVVSRAQWYALIVDTPSGQRLVARVGRYAAVQLDESRTMVFGGIRPYVATAATITDVTGAVVVRGATASAQGNALQARGATPAVEIAASGNCLFSNNTCELRLTVNAPAVRLTGGTTIVSANRVEGSVELLGNAKRLTVLGNITNGPIVAGGPLTSPWDELNIRV